MLGTSLMFSNFFLFLPFFTNVFFDKNNTSKYNKIGEVKKTLVEMQKYRLNTCSFEQLCEIIRVHCRTGSLEERFNIFSKLLIVHCRTGSLEEYGEY